MCVEAVGAPPNKQSIASFSSELMSEMDELDAEGCSRRHCYAPRDCLAGRACRSGTGAARAHPQVYGGTPPPPVICSGRRTKASGAEGETRL